MILIRFCFFILILFLLFACRESKKSTLVTATTSIKKDTAVTNNLEISISKILGTLQPSEDSLFTLIDDKYADRSGLYMHIEAYQAFQKLYVEAEKRGINLVIRSAARNFDYQKGIWERKWNGETILSSGENAKKNFPDPKSRALKILEYSSMPGTSRHHWGTDIDLNSFENSWFENGKGLELFNFMETVGKEYGFCRPYTTKDSVRPKGYNEEKWHYSYVPISKHYTDYAKKHLNNKLIKGFSGSEVAEEIDVVNNYVLGINRSCNH